MRGLMLVLARLILGRDLRVTGLEHIPRQGPALVVGNHVGTVDPVLLGVSIQRLDVYYMAKSELFRNPLLGWLFRRCHTFPVIRDSPDRGALRRALTVLGGGHVLLLYPEGTRSEGGEAGRPHAGAGFIARHARVPIIPVGSWGSQRVLPRGGRLPRRAPVRLTVGEPFTLPAAGPSGRPLSNQEAADLMMSRVMPLVARSQGAEPRIPLGRRTPAA